MLAPQPRPRTPSIEAGQLLVRNADIMVSDLGIFDHRRLTSKLALILGILEELRIRTRRW